MDLIAPCVIQSNDTGIEDEALLFLLNLVFYRSITLTQLLRRSLSHF
jgi:hypothetical protein